jgi:hypothetical protein
MLTGTDIALSALNTLVETVASRDCSLSDLDREFEKIVVPLVVRQAGGKGGAAKKLRTSPRKIACILREAGSDER